MLSVFLLSCSYWYQTICWIPKKILTKLCLCENKLNMTCNSCSDYQSIVIPMDVFQQVFSATSTKVFETYFSRASDPSIISLEAFITIYQNPSFRSTDFFYSSQIQWGLSHSICQSSTFIPFCLLYSKFFLTVFIFDILCKFPFYILYTISFPLEY